MRSRRDPNQPEIPPKLLGGRPETPDMSDFQIQVERLTEVPQRFEFEAMGSQWLARSAEPGPSPAAPAVELCEAEEPFRFELTASRSRDDVLIEGEITGRVALECSRCAKRYSHPLHDTYRLVLEPLKGREPGDPEGEQELAQNGLCLGEDLEAGLYRGPVIRLDGFFGEVIALAMPIQPLCDEACLGICPHCGIERTPEPGVGCGCEDEKIESPFAVLAQLKDELGGGKSE